MDASGWRRATSDRGVPYYVHHADQRTSWTHPRLAALLLAAHQLSHIKFAAYRTAVKCGRLRAALALDAVPLAAVKAAFAAHGLAAADRSASVDCAGAGAVLATLLPAEPLAAELALSVALAALDRRRTGRLPVTALKLLLALLAGGRLSDRYRYAHAELADAGARVSPPRLQLLLETAAGVAELLGEREAFGRHLVAGTVGSCAAAAAGGLTCDQLMSWLLREPQLLVWVSTMHRLAAAQHVVHSVSCGVCGARPIVGLCYTCLQCLGLHLCQECFFRGAVARGHKSTHPLQEYCGQWNRRQKTRALLATLWNKLSGGRGGRRPATLPPAAAEPAAVDDSGDRPNGDEDGDDDEETSSEDEELSSRTILDGSVSADPRLDSILGHLETEHRRLGAELRQLRHSLPAGQRLPSTPHGHIRVQLRRLRALVGRRRAEQETTPPPPRRRPAHLHSTPVTHLSQLSPIQPVSGPPSPIRPVPDDQPSAHADADAEPVATERRPESEPAADRPDGGGGEEQTTLSFSGHLPHLTAYSLSDVSPPDGRQPLPLDLSEPLAASAAVRDADAVLAQLSAALAPLEATVAAGADRWPARGLTADAPHQTAAELLELLADLESLCTSARAAAGPADGDAG